MNSDLVKSYPIQHHTRITISSQDGVSQYLGRLTSVNVYSTLGGLVAEVNQFATPDAEEPTTHELVFYPLSIRVEAVEDEPATQEPKPVQPNSPEHTPEPVEA